MEWDKKYRIDVAFIDDQHREWFRRVGKLEQAIEKGETRHAMASVLRFAVEYTQKHFADEQAFMKELEYPGLESQKKLHKVFEKYIVDVLVSLKSGKDVPPRQLHEFMTNWMIQHIKEEDLKIGLFMSQSGAGQVSPKDEVEGQRPGLGEKMRALAGLLDAELITSDDFDAKKQDMLRLFAEGPSAKAATDTLAKLDRLRVLIKEGLLTDEDLETGRQGLARAVNVVKELAGQEGLKNKMIHLKRLLDENVIDEEKFESHKVEILSKM